MDDSIPYLSYSGYKRLSSCPYSYWLLYIRNFPYPKPDDRLGSIYGSAMGRLFEYFYNDEIWRRDQPQAVLMALVDKTIDKIIYRETTPWKGKPGGVLRWKGKKSEGGNPNGLYANKEDLAADVRDSISTAFRTIRHHRLLGKDARAEVKLDTVVDGIKLGGRVDFLMRRTHPHLDRIIVDGKGSRWRDEFVDKRQLLWYAALLRENQGELPDQVGFLYWRSVPEDALSLWKVDEPQVNSFLDEVLSSVRHMTLLKEQATAAASLEQAKQAFRPVANKDNCQFCPYATPDICLDGHTLVQSLKKKKRKTV